MNNSLFGSGGDTKRLLDELDVTPAEQRPPTRPALLYWSAHSEFSGYGTPQSNWEYRTMATHAKLTSLNKLQPHIAFWLPSGRSEPMRERLGSSFVDTTTLGSMSLTALRYSRMHDCLTPQEWIQVMLDQ